MAVLTRDFARAGREEPATRIRHADRQLFCQTRDYSTWVERVEPDCTQASQKQWHYANRWRLRSLSQTKGGGIGMLLVVYATQVGRNDGMFLTVYVDDLLVFREQAQREGVVQ